ncbi:hypothetical protein JD844_010229 [Phrynosoma platyrhinos]|uniref:Paralemmin-3 n=1 Tax=Phrynosoma platyrhinos TaxID=52577 RepID=A0ABQ7THZ0_PHRPL|nr:hypothetical protein JD844_010229 [Phrynosoma platyrhinos]
MAVRGERRRLQERILATRRALEEERLRAQRLKRKSLRDRWLMEGMSAPTDDSNHVSSVWEAQTRIQELEEDLSSLQSQMQQLDNPELQLRRQQPEESVEAMKELKQSSPDGTGEVRGRSSLGSRLELAPVPPKRALRAAAKEKLQNGDMSGDGVFGSESRPEKVNDKMSPVVESGELQSHQERPEAVSATKPTLQSPNTIDAPPSHHRKLAVEEMVIRDHLGQEVGSMDAVGQKQSSISKEEECEEHTPLKNGCEDGNELVPPCGGLSEEMTPAASKSQLDGELGSRDGPEGESPTSQDELQQNSSKSLQDETSCLDSSKQQADGELGKETALIRAEQKELPGQGANKVEPAQDTVASDALATESIISGQVTDDNKEGLQESHGTEITVLGQGGDRPETLQGQSKEPLFPDQTLPMHAASEEAKLSSSPSEQISLSIQKPVSSLQDAEGSLLDQIPSSLQEVEGPLLEPVVLSLPNQSPSVFVNQNPPLQESEVSLPAQISSSMQETVLDPNPPSLQDSFSSSSEQKPSSLQGVATSLQEAKHSSLDQIPSSLHETNAKCLDQIPTSLQSTSLPDQTLSPPSDQLTSLPEEIPSSLHEMEKSSQISSALESQECSVIEAKWSFPDITSSLPGPLSSVPDQVSSLQDAQGLALEKISVELQNQVPTLPASQILSLPEADSIPQGQAPSFIGEDEHLVPKEAPVPGPDQVLPVLQDQEIPFLEAKTLSSLPEAGGSFTEESLEPLLSLPEGRKSPPSEAQAMLMDQMPASAQGQPPSPVEATQTLSEKEIAPSGVEEMPALPDQAPSPSATLQDTANVPDVLLSSSQEHAQSLLGKAAIVANQELKEGGDASLASTTTEEIPEVLGNLHAEQQPLLNKTNTSITPPEMPVGDQQQPKAGILKPQAAPNQEIPTYTTSSANTASSCQLQSTGSRQEEGQDQSQSRRKQKSCQCCSVM